MPLQPSLAIVSYANLKYNYRPHLIHRCPMIYKGKGIVYYPSFFIAIIEDFTVYGNLGSFELNIKNTLIIIVTSLQGNPEAKVVRFQNHSDGFNRLYFFNAMKNLRHPDKGIFEALPKCYSRYCTLYRKHVCMCV